MTIAPVSTYAVARRRRLLRGWAGALLAVLTVAVAVFLWAAPRDDVPVPGPGASPAEVVNAYLDAVDARDFDTANAIDGRPGSHLGRFARPMTASDVVVESVTNDGDSAVVGVTADFHGGDGSLNGGAFWMYYLDRGTDGRWRITDEGVG